MHPPASAWQATQLHLPPWFPACLGDGAARPLRHIVVFKLRSGGQVLSQLLAAHGHCPHVCRLHWWRSGRRRPWQAGSRRRITVRQWSMAGRRRRRRPVARQVLQLRRPISRRRGGGKAMRCWPVQLGWHRCVGAQLWAQPLGSQLPQHRRLRGGATEGVEVMFGVCASHWVTAGSSRRRWPDAPRLPHLMPQKRRKLHLPTTKPARSCRAGAPPRQVNTLVAPARRGQSGRNRRGGRSPAFGRAGGGAGWNGVTAWSDGPFGRPRGAAGKPHQPHIDSCTKA